MGSRYGLKGTLWFAIMAGMVFGFALFWMGRMTGETDQNSTLLATLSILGLLQVLNSGTLMLLVFWLEGREGSAKVRPNPSAT